MTKKICQKCNEEKNTGDFTKDKSRSDGLHIMCKVCKRAVDRERHSKYKDKSAARWKNRAEQVATVIKNAKSGGCVKCNETFSGCLEFHHTEPAGKDFTIANNMNRNIDVILAEIAKCVVLCGNCHQKLHAGVLEL